MKNVRVGHPECHAAGVVYRRMCAGFRKLTTPTFQDTPPCKEGSCTSTQGLINVQTLPFERGSTAQRGGGLFLFLLFLFPIFTFSQVGVPTYPTQEEIDSLNAPVAEVDTPVIEPLTIEIVEAELAYLKAKYRKDYKPLIGMDNHYTAFYGQSTNFWGAKLGLEFMERYRMGFGAYYMPKKVAMAPVLQEGATDTLYQKFRMHYYTTFFEWIFIRNFRWELALPISAGYGRAEVEQWIPGRNENIMGRWVKGKDVEEFVATFHVQAHYKIFSWVGIGLGFGWRQIISANQQIQRDFSGGILSYKIKLFPHHLYRALFHKEKILEEKGDYRWKKYMNKNLKRLKREEARRLREMK
ncbi:MAG: hypothetical protein H6602_14240 [Flavobacteriales bacterium]|nr:hypothetical protein [Flavobacteriales bacterium]